MHLEVMSIYIGLLHVSNHGHRFKLLSDIEDNLADILQVGLRMYFFDKAILFQQQTKHNFTSHVSTCQCSVV